MSTLRCWKPSPISRGSNCGSEAISPQMLSGLPAIGGRVGQSLEQLQGHGVLCPITRADVGVVPADGEEVLQQIVRPDAGEVHQFEQFAAAPRRRRHLDHDALLEAVPIDVAAGPQAANRLRKQLPDEGQIFPAADHRVHDPQLRCVDSGRRIARIWEMRISGCSR